MTRSTSSFVPLHYIPHHRHHRHHHRGSSSVGTTSNVADVSNLVVGVTTAMMMMMMAKPWKKMKSVADNQHMPELIVLDLDNTLWTPELYQLNQKKVPQAKKDIQLFPDIPLIFQSIRQLEELEPGSRTSRAIPQWAIASRAQNVDWAMQLLKEFEINCSGGGGDNNKKQKKKKKKKDDDGGDSYYLSELFPPELIQIYGGTKKRHFQQLREVSKIPYHKMMFFDDWTVNLQEVSQLGVLCCHCPNGLTLDIFQQSLDYYNDLMTEDDDSSWMGYVI